MLHDKFMGKATIMNKKDIIACILFLLIAANMTSGELIWPGEKKFAGYTTFEQLKPVFDQDTSRYGRRYLVQALPFFAEKNKIVSAPPDWLVKEIGKAVISDDQDLALEGVIATQRLNIHSLSDTLVGVYRKARMRWSGNMGRIHMPIVSCLVSFNNPQSRMALTRIVETPLSNTIASDIVPALKALDQIGDSSCVNTLGAVSSRMRMTKDSINTRKLIASAAVDTVLTSKLSKIGDLADRIKQKILARGSAR